MQLNKHITLKHLLIKEKQCAYLREMRDQRDAIAELARRVQSGETITLLCSSSCERDSRCHRSLLKTLIEAHARDV
jgi:uncharacterized protein YeaO (DUF488 family)